MQHNGPFRSPKPPGHYESVSLPRLPVVCSRRFIICSISSSLNASSMLFFTLSFSFFLASPSAAVPSVADLEWGRVMLLRTLPPLAPCFSWALSLVGALARGPPRELSPLLSVGGELPLPLLVAVLSLGPPRPDFSCRLCQAAHSFIIAQVVMRSSGAHRNTFR